MEHKYFDGLERPIALYVGRVSYEKNIASFLSMPWHGSKVVCGVGPLEADLKQKFDGVRWLGVCLAMFSQSLCSRRCVYFPSRHETFGLVMLEAMACGTPVAAYPVDGPLEVLRDPVHGDIVDKRQGGVLGEDLSQASLAALKIPREEAYAQAQTFSWKESTRLFESHLVRLAIQG